MPKVEGVDVPRVMILWDGRRLEVRSNAQLGTVLLMLDMAHAQQMGKMLQGAPGAKDLADLLRGGG